MSDRCYGTYDPFRARCAACDLASYCKDARDPSQETYLHYDSVADILPDSTTEHLAKPERMTLQAELIFALEDQKQAVGHCRLFARLLKVVERHPNTWAAVRWKLLHPEWSYSDIAKAMKCDKQLVAYHLGEAKRVMPEITHGLLIDHRHHPDKQEEKRARQRSLTGAPNLKIEISFRKLAKKVGVSESSIRRYMSGSVPNKTEIAERLGQVLNINPRTIWPEAFDDLPDERRSL